MPRPADNYNYYSHSLNVHEEPYETDEDVIECPACGSDLPEFLGTLGDFEHYRCRGCGITFLVEGE